MRITTRAEPTQIEDTFAIQSGLYLIGSMERGVTIYKQHVRAHNLAWALREIDRHGGRKIGNVAVVGGGIAGLTIAACLLCLCDEPVTVTIFEQAWDLCRDGVGLDFPLPYVA